MEKIRSGQCFLYRQNGLNSTVFDIRMASKIQGNYLQQALTNALHRYPYMMNQLIEIDGDFYLKKSAASMNVTKTKAFRQLGSKNLGYHLIDVTYWDNKICLSFHHALCDGRGIMPFLETLIYYYCCLCYKQNFAPSHVHLAEEPLLSDETQDPIRNSLFQVNQNNLPKIEIDGYILPQNKESCESYYRYEIKINRKDFIQYMKSCKATPSILLSILVSESIYSNYPNGNKSIVCSIAMDYRKEIGLENTYKNCVGSLYLPFSKETADFTPSEQALFYRNLIKEQKRPDAIKHLMNKQISLYQKLDQLSSIEEKKQVLSFLDNLCINTYVISSLGQVQLGEWEKYVESIHLYNSGVKGLRINMICAGNYFTVDFLQSFSCDLIIRSFLKILSNKKIRYIASNQILFETPKDKLYISHVS